MIDREDIAWRNDISNKEISNEHIPFTEEERTSLNELFERNQLKKATTSTIEDIQQVVAVESIDTIAQRSLTQITQQLRVCNDICEDIITFGFTDAIEQLQNSFTDTHTALAAFQERRYEEFLHMETVVSSAKAAYDKLQIFLQDPEDVQLVTENFAFLTATMGDISRTWSTLSPEHLNRETLLLWETTKKAYQTIQKRISRLQELWNKKGLSCMQYDYILKLHAENMPSAEQQYRIKERHKENQAQYLIEYEIEQTIQQKIDQLDIRTSGFLTKVFALHALHKTSSPTHTISTSKQSQNTKEQREEEEKYYFEVYTYYNKVIEQHKELLTILEEAKQFVLSQEPQMLSRSSAIRVPLTILDTFAVHANNTDTTLKEVENDLMEVSTLLRSPEVQRILRRKVKREQLSIPSIEEQGRALRIQTGEHYLSKAREQLRRQESLIQPTRPQAQPQTITQRKHTGSLASTLPVYTSSHKFTLKERIKNTLKKNRQQFPPSPLKQTAKEKELHAFDKEAQKRDSTLIHYADRAATKVVSALTAAGLRPQQIVAWERLQLTHSISKERYQKTIQLLRKDLSQMQSYADILRKNSIQYVHLQQQWDTVHNALTYLMQVDDQDIPEALQHCQQIFEEAVSATNIHEQRLQKNPNYSPFAQITPTREEFTIPTPTTIEIACSEGIRLTPTSAILLGAMQCEELKKIPFEETILTIFNQHIPVQLLHRKSPRGLREETFVVIHDQTLIPSQIHAHSGIRNIAVRHFDGHSVMALGPGFFDKNTQTQKEILEQLYTHAPASSLPRVANGEAYEQRVIKKIFSFGSKSR